MSIRILLGLVFFSCLGILGCKKTDKENPSAPIKTYAYDAIEYPTGNIQIADTLKKEFLKNFFAPWSITPENLSTELDALPGRKLSYLENYLNDDDWYGENKKKHKRWQREEIVANVNEVGFPNFLKKGITISHTNLRRIPSNKPGFDTYSKAGEGFPFDYFQETMLWANTPVLIVHTSIDKQWSYVASPYYKGWVSMHDLAIVNEDFVTQWVNGPYCMPLSDQVNLSDKASNFAINAKMGMVLPYEEIPDNPDQILVSYTNTDAYQNANILKAKVNKTAVALNNYEFNGQSVNKLVSNFIGRPYGWGGNLKNRDCSSLIRDLLGTYRIWLPRDSKDQIEIGHPVDLPDSTAEKLAFIKENGIPFLTILRKKGHNMLYVGINPDGEPLILHAIWGLKTSYSNEQLANFVENYPLEGIHQDEDGKLKGRHLIGEAVITSVNIGADNNDVTIPLIDEIYAMTNILGDPTK
ncbi:SH3 domain-containing C40 family peptidase [Flagellimonas flava]|uniref:Cell wall-associated hydrolase, NlpC family n=1 Tax=Flagellimonas flava TaxID=570519 RepID=A0A1M5LVD6_9FLAO|nr:SH3 domain-containing C40 family peptidase [Allomuricauda flava]SHG69074.1 Cell wall-associated hydrolase, NlpC family [Allomuricauda flava]